VDLCRDLRRGLLGQQGGNSSGKVQPTSWWISRGNESFGVRGDVYAGKLVGQEDSIERNREGTFYQYTLGRSGSVAHLSFSGNR